jgi:class 3 adenylate cyclase
LLSHSQSSLDLLNDKVVFENPCTPPFTFEINGPSAIYLGTGDFHDSQYNDMAQGSMIYDLRSFSELSSSFYSGLPLEESFCPLMVTVYPSKTKEDSYTTSTPWVFALLTGCVFIFTVLAFIVYNCVVERRQKIVYKSAMVSNALVSSLFPEEVKKQLMKTHELEELGMSTGHDMSAHKLQGFLDEEYNGGIADKIDIKNANQIAELFPDTTVMFADITGFTAWSSTREPSHVFTLLETLYGAFDQSARKMGIFKVETIGDCYVAVCGLPTPTSHHATKMARFASICIDLMKSVTGKLELSLGPGTADLLLRVGLHSGPTIAGVLRGEKARFQLFGDTVNTASRMESNSLPSKIHVSQSTADLITKAGKDHWLTPREDRVETKGKGLLQTYWIDPKKHKSLGSVRSSTGGTEGDDSNSGSVNDDSANIFVADDPKTVRLVNWNVSIFEDLLKVIAESRQANSGDAVATVVKEDVVPEGKSVRDSAVPSLKMPGFNTANCRLQGSAELSSEVKYELNLFITAVADLYTSSNAFHNFDHASHVIMSTVKLLQRVATSEIVKANELDAKQHHESTYGIGTDPLTKFAIVFSALVHDLDHAGVPNGQLVKENDPIALSYENGSQMEQHSFTLAFELLLNEEYQNLRAAIYETQEEYDRFRQLCINCVIATDVFDKELKTFRESRWEKAFNDTSTAVISKEEEFNMRGTIAVEYIIQASDVAHTMQHWHVYQRWNKRLFLEMRDAYKAGRAEKDPAEGWYKGELWFFDNYIIPLAQKLKECEVFGVDCDQLLDYAAQNRKEWCSKGEDIVAQWVAEAEQAHTVSD